MALITDPDLLTQGTEVVFDTAAKTVQLVATGNLSSDGVTLQALYSFTKEEWKSDANLIKYPFPFEAITAEQFEFKNGWTYADTTTVELIRNAGFAVRNADNSAIVEEFAGIITLGSLGPTDQVYYQQTVGGDPVDFVLPDAVNQCVKIYGDASHGSLPKSNVFNIFVREQAKTYADSNLGDIGVTNMTYQVYRFPLANAADLKVTESDVTVDAYGVTIDYTGSFVHNIGGTNRDFSIQINGNGKTAEEIYMAVQSLLRKTTDIDSGVGTVRGDTADALLTFVGDTLVTSTGVYVDGYQLTDQNRIEFYDDLGIKRTYPFVAAGTIFFNENLQTDPAAEYRMFYSDNFGSSSAELVLDNSDVAISGTVSSNASITFSYDYDGDTAGGGAGVDKDVTVVGIGLTKGQYVVATGTITRSTSNSVSLVSSLERNYDNQ